MCDVHIILLDCINSNVEMRLFNLRRVIFLSLSCCANLLYGLITIFSCKRLIGQIFFFKKYFYFLLVHADIFGGVIRLFGIVINFLFLFPITVLYQKRFKKERKVRVRLQQQLESELKRRSQIEDALKASGAPAETLRLISGELICL